MSEFVQELRDEFKEAHGRETTLSDSEIEALEKDDEEGLETEEWFRRILEAEKSKERKKQMRSLKKSADETKSVNISAKNSPESLADKINKDHDADILAVSVFKAGELGRRAPAQCAIILRNHYTPDELVFFAVPYSDQKEGKDGDKVRVGDNERTGYIWDYYQRGGKNGQWYLNYVDKTETGIAINTVLNTIDKMDEDKNIDTNVMLDGEKQDLKKIILPERIKLRRTYDRRRRSLAGLYRKAIQIINMWQAIRDSRFGAAYNSEGRIIGGKVDIDWVWANAQDKTQGLARGDCPIRLKELNPTNGIPTGNMLDMSVNEFLNLDIKNVAGNTYEDLINSKKEKPDKTKKGQGKKEEKKQTDLDAKAVIKQMLNLRLYTEKGAPKANFLVAWANLKEGDERDQASFDIVQVRTWLAEVIDQEMINGHDRVANSAGVKTDKIGVESGRINAQQKRSA